MARIFASREDFQINLGGSRLEHGQFFGGAVREIEHPALVKVTTVGNADYDRAVVLAVGYADNGAERQCGVAGRHGIHIECFTAGGVPPVEYATVPGGYAVEHIGLL